MARGDVRWRQHGGGRESWVQGRGAPEGARGRRDAAGRRGQQRQGVGDAGIRVSRGAGFTYRLVITLCVCDATAVREDR
eukprot:3018654-Prymnesium_polylepis.2